MKIIPQKEMMSLDAGEGNGVLFANVVARAKLALGSKVAMRDDIAIKN